MKETEPIYQEAEFSYRRMRIIAMTIVALAFLTVCTLLAAKVLDDLPLRHLFDACGWAAAHGFGESLLLAWPI